MSTDALNQTVINCAADTVALPYANAIN